MSMGSTLHCPRCKAENSLAADFCERCGFGLEETGTLSASAVREIPSSVDPATWVGRVIGGKYEILSVLGEGGFGIVFKVQLSIFDEQSIFALKMLRPDLSRNEPFRRRFLREARTALGLVHPNAIPVREFGQTDDGLLYFTMDFCAGEPLQSVLSREGYLTVNRAIPLAIQMLDVMEAAHAREIIHRDLKPDNVFLERDPATGREEVRIGDFGLAKSLGREGTRLSSDITKGGIVGTPRYMSPEQARGEPLDPRSDLYSIGVMLFEMVTGELPPRSAAGNRGLLGTGLETELGRLREMIPPNLVVPRGVLEVLARVLQEKPSARFQTAREFREALEVLPSYTPTYIEPRAPHRGFLRRAMVASLVFLVVLAAGGWVLFPELRSEARQFALAFFAPPGNAGDGRVGEDKKGSDPGQLQPATAKEGEDDLVQTAFSGDLGSLSEWIPLSPGAEIVFETTIYHDDGTRSAQSERGTLHPMEGEKGLPMKWHGEANDVAPEWWRLEEDGFFRIWAMDDGDGVENRYPVLLWLPQEGHPPPSWEGLGWSFVVQEDLRDLTIDGLNYDGCLVVVATADPDRRKIEYFARGVGIVRSESRRGSRLLLRRDRQASP